MKGIHLKAVFAILILSLTSQAQAVLITETWQSTITNVNLYSAYTVGDVFEWTVTFDNESQHNEVYNDGINRLAEGGNGDDTLNQRLCTTAYIGPLQCDRFTSSALFPYYSNAIFDLSEFELITQSYRIYDNHSINRAYAAFDENTVGDIRYMNADNILFDLHAIRTWYFDPVFPTQRLDTARFSSHRTAVNGTIQNVDEPSSMALLTFGFGLFGLLSFLKKRRVQNRLITLE